MEPRAWVGMNLGRSVRSPGAYNVWVPSSGRIVVSSDVYFDEPFTRGETRNAGQTHVRNVPTGIPTNRRACHR
eukprot:1284519-Pleurochrysis_carterae.AAC.1